MFSRMLSLFHRWNSSDKHRKYSIFFLLVRVDGGLDPVFESGRSRVDARVSRAGASDSPRNNAQNRELVAYLFHHRTAGITLARVDTADVELSGAEHGTGDGILVAVSVFAVLLRDHRDGGDLQRARRAQSLSRAAPTRNRQQFSLRIIGVFVGES